jgi:predicted AlkP superfamily phosphohydrolase/phosphomutase/tetratricopeptide (TPR) repeat protein
MASRKVLLIGWDAADWKVIHPLMDAGKMPNVQRLVENGAHGQIATLHPPLSPMLWTSIATGKRPFKHGIHGFSEPTPDGRGVQPVTNLSRKSKALWNILNQNDLRSVVIGWWPSHPAEPINGVMVSDHYHRASRPIEEGWPLAANAVHPPELAGTLANRRMHPDLLTPQMVESFIPLAKEIDQDRDKRLTLLLRVLAECMTIHSAATWLLDNQPWDFFAVYYDAIDHFCHGFMRYHPPRQSWITERDFELYHNVVSMAYQFHNQMLGTLLEKAGHDATVILLSDHGFHPDHLRPDSIPDIPAGPAIEHRDLGILAISGPGIVKNELLRGPSLLDIAPTILTLYGLPVGEDMDGKVLSEAFVEAPCAKFIPSWEDVAGNHGSHPPHTHLDPVAAHEALEQMIGLGYIERPDEDRQVAVAKTIRELRYNLGEAYQDAGRHLEAHQIFSELYAAAESNDHRFAVRLFASCQALGMLDEMRRIVDDLEASFPSPLAGFLKAQVLIAEKRFPEALAALEQVADAHLLRPGLFLQTADLYMRLRRWQDAQQVYEKALEIDPDNAQAHIGLCRMALRQRRFSDAAHWALAALERVYHDPLAHFLLGLALTGMKEFERAAEAFRTAISFNPNFPQAHLRLASLLDKHLGDLESAREHRRLARRMRSRTPAPEPIVEPVVFAEPVAPIVAKNTFMSPPSGSVIIVTGLPRSGTSMLMQMLSAGGASVLSDGRREPDEDNPRGYLEFEPVKNLFNDSKWLFQAQGKAVKIVAPLLAVLPPDLPCRVILCQRDLDEVLDSQERMLAHRNQPLAATPLRRRMLKDEYARTLVRVKTMLARRPATQLLVVEQRAAISDPLITAEKINGFLGGELDVAKMAAAVDPALTGRAGAPHPGYSRCK